MEEDIRKKVDFVCQWHNRSMELIPGKYSLYRRCPAVLSNGSRCYNHLSIPECQRIYAELEYWDCQEMLKPHYENRIDNVKYVVSVVDQDYVAVKINNLKVKKPTE